MKIALTDLSHDNFYGSVTTPYGVGLVAEYAKSHIDERFDFSIYKRYARFIKALNVRYLPAIVGLSNYMWNMELSLAAAREVKLRSPHTPIVMGGPNYPSDSEKQKTFHFANPAVDFYIFNEAEVAFTGLLEVLMDFDLDVGKVKENRIEIPGVHYTVKGELVRGPTLKRYDIDQNTSPYTSGLLDEFLEEDFGVLTQRTRGCPYSCTFCQEGVEYFNKIRKRTISRISEELEYVAERVAGKKGRRETLYLADANFGAFREDVEVADAIVRVQTLHGWPKKLDVATSKNRKDRVLEVIGRINSMFPSTARLTASVQSTDEQVLENIKRKNISVADLTELTQTAKQLSSYGEVILGLPGDTFAKHVQSVRDLISADISRLTFNWLALLPGTEMEAAESRRKYQYQSGFRVIPGAYGFYQGLAESQPVFESIELVVGNNTMSEKDYFRCVEYDFILECFYNDNIFAECTGFVRTHNLSLAAYFDEIYECVSHSDGEIKRACAKLQEARRNELLPTVDALKEYWTYKGVVDENDEISELQNNASIATQKAILVFDHMEELNRVAFDALYNMLEKIDEVDEEMKHFLVSLQRHSLNRKMTILDDGKLITDSFNYDFIRLQENGFQGSPSEYSCPVSKIEYRCNEVLLERADFYGGIYQDQSIVKRKLLYESRSDDLDEFFRSATVTNNLQI